MKGWRRGMFSPPSPWSPAPESSLCRVTPPSHTHGGATGQSLGRQSGQYRRGFWGNGGVAPDYSKTVDAILVIGVKPARH
jgi:hypothetical protein